MGNCIRCGRGLENEEQQHAMLCGYCLAGNSSTVTEAENVVDDMVEELDVLPHGSPGSGLEYAEVRSGVYRGTPCIIVVLTNGTHYRFVAERVIDRSNAPRLLA